MLRTFVFWNLRKKPLEDLIAQLSLIHQVDVFVFAECDIPPATLLTALNSHSEFLYHYAPGIGCRRIEIYARFSDSFIRPIFESDSTTIRRMRVPGSLDILLAAIHWPSKMHWDKDDQSFECTTLAQQLRQVEQDLGHRRTILVGDLNMDPFEIGVVAAHGLHAVMSKAIARRQSRKVKQTGYSFFYNPMWNLFGDRTEGPPGTYYYDRSGRPINYYWNMFDQVMIRPDLLDFFLDDQLKILASVGSTNLLSKDIPNTKLFSDHLPLLFALDI